MLRTIVVPLDGSHLAEQALPYAERLAEGAATRLMLCRVVTSEIIHKGGRDLALAEKSRTYLQAVERQLTGRGRLVQSMVESGDPASSILERARSSEADLIVMATHGRSGPGRWLYGSVADEVLRHSPIPVCLVPAIASTPWPPDRSPTIMVTLDGSEIAEAALMPARELAQRLESELLLLNVVPFPPASAYAEGTYMPPFDPTEQLQWAEQYLGGVASRLKLGVGRVRRLTQVGQPAVAIAEVAAREQVGLIAMATHGRSGLARVVLGSVATGTLQLSRVPLLLVGPATRPIAATSDTHAAALTQLVTASTSFEKAIGPHAAVWRWSP